MTSFMAVLGVMAVSMIMTSLPATLKGVMKGCQFEGRVYPSGSRFQPDACTRCRCPPHGGQPQCIVEDCGGPGLHCVVPGNKTKDVCCPPCLEYGCRYSDGRLFREGEVIRAEPCVRCLCPNGGGAPVCDVTSCPLSECVDPVHVPGVCCPMCPNGPNCQFGLFTLPIGQSVMIEGTKCTCERFQDGEGVNRTEARCSTV